MSWFCDRSQAAVQNAISVFNNTILVSFTALSRASFTSQTAAIISQFIELTPVSDRRMNRFLAELGQGALLPTAFNTDWLIEYGNASNDYLLRSVPRHFANKTCNCLASSACYEPMRVGPPDLILPGLVVGCWPIHGLFMSTLECFFSSSCIDTIISYLDYYIEMDGSPPTNFTIPKVLALQIKPLDELVSSRFSPNTTIGTLIDELLIEKWRNTSSYESYYATCAPSVCRYEYISRNDALYVITSMLSFYGGLTVSLRFIVWNIMEIYQLIKRRLRTRQTPIEPWTI